MSQKNGGSTYYETHKEKIKSYSEKRRREQGAKKRVTDAQILKIYYDNPNDTWEQLAEKMELPKSKWVKTRVGIALMNECRKTENCPMKALLPEYWEQEEKP